MRAKELKEILNTLDDDLIIVMSKDGEGNGYSPLSDIEHNLYYEAKTTWSGDIAYRDDYDPEDKMGEPCVVLWPVN